MALVKKIPDEQKLLQKILNGYDTAARPVFNASHIITVKFGLTLIQLADMVSTCAPNLDRVTTPWLKNFVV